MILILNQKLNMREVELHCPEDLTEKFNRAALKHLDVLVYKMLVPKDVPLPMDDPRHVVHLLFLYHPLATKEQLKEAYAACGITEEASCDKILDYGEKRRQCMAMSKNLPWSPDGHESGPTLHCKHCGVSYVSWCVNKKVCTNVK